MTGAENERLAVVETQLAIVAADVHDIKADVKVLLAARHRALGVGQLFMRALPFLALGVSAYAVVVR